MEWNDSPTGISYKIADQNAVWASNGEITVVDAKSPIQVYSVSGKLVSSNPISSVTTIPVAQKEFILLRSRKL